MSRLSKYLFLLSLVLLISLGIFIVSIYRQDAQFFPVLNITSLRFLTFTSLLIMAGLSFGTGLVFWKKSMWGENAQVVIDQYMDRNWVHNSVFLFSVSTFFFVTIPIWNIFIRGDARILSLLIRFSPIVFLIGSLSLILIRTKYFQENRKMWVKVVLISSLCFGAAILLQSILMNKLEQPLPVSIRSQFVYAIVCLIFSITLIRQNLYDSYLLLILVGLVVVLFMIQWFVFPHKLRGMLPGILLNVPIIIVGLPLTALFLLSFWKWLRVKTHEKVIWVVQGLLVASLIILAITYYQAATIHSQEVNIDSAVSDQSAYMGIIKEARRLNFNYTGDQNRMPLYPFFQALFYSTDMDDLDLFEQGKQYNLILSIVLLFLLFLVLFRLFGLFRSYLLILIIGFSFFIFKAAYVQAEILYYSLSALSFVLLLMMLTRPTWIRSITAGIVTGLAYLTKGTILSSLPLFALLYGIDLLLFSVRKNIDRHKEASSIIARRAAYLLVVLVMFAAIIFPYAQALKQRFGFYFYNVNTTFYIWYDEWEEAREDDSKHQFRKQWPAHLSDDELPSLRNYVRDHTWEEIVGRFISGVQSQYQNIFFKPFSVTNYWISYLLILLIGMVINIDNFRKFVKSNAIPFLFVIFYFGGYLIAFAWYCPIACGPRFTYALYIPFLIVIFLVMRELVKYQTKKIGKVENKIDLGKYFSASHLIVAFTLVFNIWLVTNNVLFIDAYGS